MLWPLVLGVVLLAAGVFIGYRWAGDRAAPAWLARDVALHRADSLAHVAAGYAEDAITLTRQRDSIATVAARQRASGSTWRRKADSATTALETYRDSVTEAGDDMVPVAQLDTALAVIAWRGVVIDSLQAYTTTLQDQLTAAGKLDIVRREQVAHWKGRAEELEKVLIDLKPPTKPRLLGILTVPSPTVAFVAGAVAGFALR